MLIRQINEVKSSPVGMAGAAGVSMRLLLGRDDGAPTFAMRHFEVQPQGHTPHHQHNYEHEVLILEGEGELVDGEAAQAIHQPIRGGDVIFIPANEMHQFRNTGRSPLRFICLVPTKHDCTDGSGCLPTPGS